MQSIDLDKLFKSGKSLEDVLNIVSNYYKETKEKTKNLQEKRTNVINSIIEYYKTLVPNMEISIETIKDIDKNLKLFEKDIKGIEELINIILF